VRTTALLSTPLSDTNYYNHYADDTDKPVGWPMTMLNTTPIVIPIETKSKCFNKHNLVGCNKFYEFGSNNSILAMIRMSQELLKRWNTIFNDTTEGLPRYMGVKLLLENDYGRNACFGAN
jgi:hypothetical protein